MNYYSDDTGFIEVAYHRITDDLLKGGSYVIELAIVNSLILAEYLVKESLRKENVLLPYSLNSLHSTPSTLAMLIKVGPEDTPEARYDDLGILLQRSKALSALPTEAVSLVERLKDDRNRIVHDPRHTVDTLTAHIMLIDLFVDHKESMRNVLGLDLASDTQQQLELKKQALTKELSNRLDHKIKAARELYDHLDKSEKQVLKTAELDLSTDQFFIIDQQMRCPACYNKTLFYIGEVDFDYDGPRGSMWFECAACKLQMSEYDFDELNTYPSKYINSDESDDTWSEYYSYVDTQANAYEYI